jgi:hypothetical protein
MRFWQAPLIGAAMAIVVAVQAAAMQSDGGFAICNDGAAPVYVANTGGH